MAQPTPGPWLNHNGLVTGVESRERFKGDCSIDIFDVNEWPGELHEEALANARLIAIAPDLLDLARRVAEHFEGLENPLAYAARAALAKVGL